MREELKGCWTNQILLKLYTRRPHASPTSEFDLLDEEDQIRGGQEKQMDLQRQRQEETKF